MTHAYLYDHVRTPRGKGKKDGSLHQASPVSLLRPAVKALVTPPPPPPGTQVSEVVGDPKPERGPRTGSEHPENGGSAAANADGDRVEISDRGHRLQVEGEVNIDLAALGFSPPNEELVVLAVESPESGLGVGQPDSAACGGG